MTHVMWAPSACPDIESQFEVLVTSSTDEPDIAEIARLLSERIPELGEVLVVTDSNLFRLFGERLISEMARCGHGAYIAMVPAGERGKQFAAVQSLLRAIQEHRSGKPVAVVALGGGSICNIVTLACSLVGTRAELYLVPTSVMAQSDVVVGSKGLANLPSRKNAVRAFLNPRLAVIDAGFLATLPTEELRSGLAESVKHALTDSPEFLLKWVDEPVSAIPVRAQREIVLATIASKCRLLKGFFDEVGKHPDLDPPELQYGHTVGHAIENLRLGTIRHGEAVMIGMLVAVEIALQLDLVSEDCVELHHRFARWLETDGALLGSIDRRVVRNELARTTNASPSGFPMVLLSGIGLVHRRTIDWGRSVVPYSVFENAWDSVVEAPASV